MKAYLVPDGSFEPLRLALAFAATAKAHGVKFLTYTEVKRILVDGKRRASGVIAWDRSTGAEYQVGGDLIINATGAWAGQLAEKAGVDVPVRPTPGVMVAFDRRLTQRVINRLNVPDDGDIALPQRRMIVVGTTSYEATDLDYVPVVKEQVALMLERGSQMIPGLRACRMRGAYMSSRPLIGAGADARSVARTFKCIDHAEDGGVEGFITITGGKATTCRAMAEKTADIACAKLGISAACTTRDMPLRSYRDYYCP